MQRLLLVLAFLLPATPSFTRQSPSFERDTRIDLPSREHPDLILLRAQMRAHKNLPTVDLWYAVGRCETALGVNGKDTWNRGAHWTKTPVGGALGIHVQAWKGYGGLRFAKKPALASKWAQMYVANNIAFLGFQTDEYLTLADKLAHRPFYRPAVGFSQGWGGSCTQNWFKQNG